MNGITVNKSQVMTFVSHYKKALQEELKLESNKQPLSGQSFRIGAALYLLDKGERLERIMLTGGW